MDVDSIPNRGGSPDNDNTRQAAMTHGTVYTELYFSGQYYSYSTKSYWPAPILWASS